MQLTPAEVHKQFVSLWENIETNASFLDSKDNTWNGITEVKDVTLRDLACRQANLTGKHRVVGLIKGTDLHGIRFLVICPNPTDSIFVYESEKDDFTTGPNSERPRLLVESECGAPLASVYRDMNHGSLVMNEAGLDFIQYLVRKVPNWLKHLAG